MPPIFNKMSHCKYCNKEKENIVSYKGPSGETLYGKQCRDCKNKRRIKRARSTKKDFLAYKSKLNCEECGFTDWRALQFHHKNPRNKDLELASTVGKGWSLNKIKKEIRKCKCLCANCHQILHFKIREKRF